MTIIISCTEGQTLTDDAIRESMVRRFQTIPGIGMSKAEVLYDSGYTTISSLKKADAESLAKVKGISPAMARFILREVKNVSDEEPAAEGPKAGETKPAKREDDETASISVAEEGAVTISAKEGDEARPAEDDGETPVAVEAPKAEEASSGGIFSGFVKSLKSLFGGGSEPPATTESRPSEAPAPKAEEAPSEPVTVKEESAEPKPDAVATDKDDEKKEDGPVKDAPKANEPEEKAKDGPKEKAEDKPKTEAKSEKGGENEKLVEDIIKELELDKENR